MQINKLIKDKRLSQAILGISGEKVTDLLKAFDSVLTKSKKDKKRKRAVGGGQKGAFATTLEKLVFILMYCKVYPTFDVCGYFFDINRSQACRWVQKLLPILEKALGIKLVLPERKINSVEEFFRTFPNAKDVFVDGTERRIQKSTNKKKSNKTYSGKKKTNTKKVIVICDEKKRIGYLSESKSGRRHDKKLLDKADITRNIPEKVCVWADTGFKGLDKDHKNTIMPKKASKNKPLSQEDKDNNKVISGIRIVVEHAIGGMKRLGCMSNVYRNRTPKMDDKFALLSAGLWNLHLQA